MHGKRLPAVTSIRLADGGAEQVPDAVGEGQAERPADHEPQDRTADAASAQAGAEGTGQGERDQSGITTRCSSSAR